MQVRNVGVQLARGHCSFGSPLVGFVLASAVFWFIDAHRDHCADVSGEQMLRSLTEGVPDRTGPRSEGERPDDVIPVARPLPRDGGSVDDRQRGCDHWNVAVLPANEHHSRVAAQQAASELLFLTLSELASYRQPQMLA